MEPGDSFQREFQHFNAISIVFNEVRQDEPCQSQRSASLTLSVYTCILLIHGVLCTQRAAHLFRSLTQGLKTLLPIFNSISIFLELRPCPCVTTPRPRDVPAKKVLRRLGTNPRSHTGERGSSVLLVFYSMEIDTWD